MKIINPLLYQITFVAEQLELKEPVENENNESPQI